MPILTQFYPGLPCKSRVRKYTDNILNSLLYRLQAGLPCARGGKRAAELIIKDPGVTEYTILLHSQTKSSVQGTSVRFVCKRRGEAGVATGLMVTDLGVNEYTISILNSPLYRLQAGIPCARGGKRGHRAHAKGPQGQQVHRKHSKLTLCTGYKLVYRV